MRARPGGIDSVTCAAHHNLASAAVESRSDFQTARIGDPFGVVVDATGHTRPQPEPEVFLLAMEKPGMDAESCRRFKDPVNGVEAANAAKAVVVTPRHLIGRFSRKRAVISWWTGQPN
jgi:beta-phosphoglucomutase-like phosphatase (HAD superfamily)